MSTPKTSDQKIQEIFFLAENNIEHSMLAKVIPASGYKAYMLVDKNGNEETKTFTTTRDLHQYFILFNGLWIENGEVYSLNLASKAKDIYMGKHVTK